MGVSLGLWIERVASEMADKAHSDNNEFYTRDDALLFKNEFNHKREVMAEGSVSTGLMGRITGNEMMNKVRYLSSPRQALNGL